MRKGIQESFLFSPVVSIHPVFSNSFKIFSIESILKSNTFQTRYNSCCSTQSVMQIRQYLNFLNIQILNSNLIQMAFRDISNSFLNKNRLGFISNNNNTSLKSLANLDLLEHLYCGNKIEKTHFPKGLEVLSYYSLYSFTSPL